MQLKISVPPVQPADSVRESSKWKLSINYQKLLPLGSYLKQRRCTRSQNLWVFTKPDKAVKVMLADAIPSEDPEQRLTWQIHPLRLRKKASRLPTEFQLNNDEAARANIQHCTPITNANSNTGAVYCPPWLYTGCVTKTLLLNKMNEIKRCPLTA